MSFLKKFKNKRFRNNSFKSNNFRNSSFGSSGFKSKNKGFKNNPFKNKRFKIYAGIAVIILLILGVLAYVDSKNTELQANENFIETYTIPENEKIFINGMVVPKQTKDFNISGDYELSDVNVTNGQKVNQGDLLFTAKNPTIIAEIDSLKSQLSQYKKQKISLSDIAENKDAIASINAQITALNSQIASLDKKAYDRVTAPFDGTVYLNDQTGNPDQPVSFMTIQGLEFYMKGQASEQDLPKMKIDQMVNILVFSTDQKLTGRISFISDKPSTPNTEMGTQQNTLSYYDINIAFDNQEGLVNGFHLQASLEVANSSFKIPASCVLKDNKHSYVFKDLDGILKKQIVDVASQNDDFAVVRGGLEQGDIIIKHPTKEMKEGDPVQGDGVTAGSNNGDTTPNKKVEEVTMDVN
ncbi:TPA: efflux RND transporter periplasmic adaptor subunit [Clostridioides difficile]|nr:efflux RND transporter periplasmic adaptor subunit [Clostridioides difficile]HBF4755721.1 efflux RND transporter periplasmic adaptor subunit [Clostridioides difficile]HBF9630835.1 efflux RND transporter periplasmic adaptor subunit [Clostridioides difficile]